MSVPRSVPVTGTDTDGLPSPRATNLVVVICGCSIKAEPSLSKDLSNRRKNISSPRVVILVKSIKSIQFSLRLLLPLLILLRHVSHLQQPIELGSLGNSSKLFI